MSNPSQNSAEPDVSVSVVTYNSAQDLPGLLESLHRQSGVRWELLAVDNASTDSSVDVLTRLAPEAHLIRNATNVGFGAAHNQNLPLCRGRYLLLLNPDLTFEDGLLRSLTNYLDAHPEIAIAGPELLHGTPVRQILPYHDFPGEHFVPLPGRDDSAEIAWVSGACFAVRTDVIRELRGFDEDYFLYTEEVDLCFRAMRAGWRIGYEPRCQVRHTAFGSQPELSSFDRLLRIARASTIFYQKHYSPELLPTLHRSIVLSASVKLSIFKLLKALRFLPGALRRWIQLSDVLSREPRFRARARASREWLVEHNLPVYTWDWNMNRMLGYFVKRSWKRMLHPPQIAAQPASTSQPEPRVSASDMPRA